MPFGGAAVRGGMGGTVSGGAPNAGGTTPLGGTGTVNWGGSSTAGGSTAFGGNGTGGTGACPTLLDSNEELIDDMEDGDPYILWVSGRAGAWSVFYDTTQGATIWPGSPFVMSDTYDACHGLAARAYGGQFVYSGAGLGFGIGGPYNASAFNGLSFWAKSGTGQEITIRVTFADKDTALEGGLCSPDVTATLCWNDFGKYVAIPATWTKIRILFAELRQLPGWGNQPAGGFDPASIYRVQFYTPPGAQFDLWIDEAALTLPMLT
jgi:hypothetical protein